MPTCRLNGISLVHRARRVCRPIVLVCVLFAIASTSVMGMTTKSAPIGTAQTGDASTPVSHATPAVAVSPVVNVVNRNQSRDEPGADVDQLGPGIVRSLIPATIGGADNRVYDAGSLLSNTEEETLEGDAKILERYGVPVLVFVRRSSDTVSESQAFADTLRTQRDVASMPGADDGLVILLTTGLQSRFGGSVVFSIGPNAFPVQGLDAESLDQIYRRDIIPNVRQGRIFDGLNIGIRNMTYIAQFVPGKNPPRSSRQHDVASVMAIVAPVGTGLLGLLLIVQWVVPVALLRRIHISRTALNKVLIAGGLALAAVMTPLAIYARSDIGAGSVVVLLTVLALNGLFGRNRRQGPRLGFRKRRTLAVSPRLAGPGTTRPRSVQKRDNRTLTDRRRR